MYIYLKKFQNFGGPWPPTLVHASASAPVHKSNRKLVSLLQTWDIPSGSDGQSAFLISSCLHKNYNCKTVSNFLLLEFPAHWFLIHLLKKSLYYFFYITCELFMLLALKLNPCQLKGYDELKIEILLWRWLHDFLVP